MRIPNAYLVAIAAAIAACSSIRAQNDITSIGFISVFQTPSLQTVAPGGIVTLFTTALNVPDAAASQIPLPTSLSGVSIHARVIGAKDATGYPELLPVLRVYTQNSSQMPDGVPCPTNPNSILCSQTQITVEIPTERVCAPPPTRPPETCSAFIDLPPLLILNVNANGVASPDLLVRVADLAPRLLNSCDALFGPPRGTCQSLVTHADGTPVSNDSPAKVGEVVTVYAVGFGAKLPATGYAPTAPIQMMAGGVTFQYISRLAGFDTLPNEGAYATASISVAAEWAGQVPGYVGLFQLNVKVPPAPGQSYNTCGGNGNADITFPTPTAGTLYICVSRPER